MSHAFDILATVGMAGLPKDATERAIAAGAWHRNDGRLCFSEAMIHEAMARAPRNVTMPGFTQDQDLQIGGGHVHIGTGSAAVQILDAATD